MEKSQGNNNTAIITLNVNCQHSGKCSAYFALHSRWREVFFFFQLYKQNKKQTPCRRGTVENIVSGVSREGEEDCGEDQLLSPLIREMVTGEGGESSRKRSREEPSYQVPALRRTLTVYKDRRHGRSTKS